jgi:hypothetical protein
VLDVDADATEPPTWARKDNVEFWREAVRLRGLLLDAIDAHEPDTAA